MALFLTRTVSPTPAGRRRPPAPTTSLPRFPAHAAARRPRLQFPPRPSAVACTSAAALGVLVGGTTGRSDLHPRLAVATASAAPAAIVDAAAASRSRGGVANANCERHTTPSLIRATCLRRVWGCPTAARPKQTPAAGAV